MNQRIKAYHFTKGRCFYCGEELIDDFVLDHVIPKSRGGIGGNNLVACCRECNAFKSDLSVEQFRSEVENLIYNDFHGRILRKYLGIKRKHFQFYFEKKHLLEEKKDVRS